MTDLHIAPVTGKKGAQLFAQAAFNARRGDPSWTAPFSIETSRLFNATGTPFNRANAPAFCVAFMDGTPVGRIMLVKNRQHLETYHDGSCHFGFLEAIDHPAIIPALMIFAGQWAKAQGLSRLEGPYSASINHEIGLLIDGDGTPTTFKTNDAPPRYARELEKLGFHGVKDILAVEGEVATSTYPERVARSMALWADGNRFALRPFNLFNIQDSVRTTNRVYGEAWAENWHMLVPEQDEAVFIARMMLPWVKPAWLKTAYFDGKPIGVASLIPDLNEAAHGLDGRLWPFGWARYFGRLHLRPMKRARLALIGVSRAFHNTRTGHMAASALLADAIVNARKAGVERLEVSWMLEDNAAVLNLSRSLPAQLTRRWRIYGRDV